MVILQILLELIPDANNHRHGLAFNPPLTQIYTQNKGCFQYPSGETDFFSPENFTIPTLRTATVNSLHEKLGCSDQHIRFVFRRPEFAYLSEDLTVTFRAFLQTPRQILEQYRRLGHSVSHTFQSLIHNHKKF
jgi:hypothetical protein